MTSPAAAGVVFAAVAALCLLPDDSWDTVAYHLAIGKIYAREGRIAYLPWLFQSNFPVNGELLFLHGLLLDGDRLALPLNLVPYGVAAVATFKLARLHLARGPALLAMVVFMVTPEVAAWVTTCNVEITWAAFAGFALWCTLRWRGETAGRDAWLYLAGLFAGCAAGTKVVAILSGAALGAIILGSALDRRRGLASLTPVLRTPRVSNANRPLIAISRAMMSASLTRLHLSLAIVHRAAGPAVDRRPNRCQRFFHRGSVGGRRSRGAVFPPSPRGVAARERGPPPEQLASRGRRHVRYSPTM